MSSKVTQCQKNINKNARSRLRLQKMCRGVYRRSCQHGCNHKNIKVAKKNLLSIHYIICRKHLAVQKLSPELNDIMIQAVKIIICDQVLHLRLF